MRGQIGSQGSSGGGFCRLRGPQDSISDAGGNLSLHRQAEAFPEGRETAVRCAAGRTSVAIVGIVCIVSLCEPETFRGLLWLRWFHVF